MRPLPRASSKATRSRSSARRSPDLDAVDEARLPTLRWPSSPPSPPPLIDAIGGSGREPDGFAMPSRDVTPALSSEMPRSAASPRPVSSASDDDVDPFDANTTDPVASAAPLPWPTHTSCMLVESPRSPVASCSTCSSSGEPALDCSGGGGVATRGGGGGDGPRLRSVACPDSCDTLNCTETAPKRARRAAMLLRAVLDAGDAAVAVGLCDVASPPPPCCASGGSSVTTVGAPSNFRALPACAPCGAGRSTTLSACGCAPAGAPLTDDRRDERCFCFVAPASPSPTDVTQSGWRLCEEAPPTAASVVAPADS